MWWSKVVCATLGLPDPMSPPQAAKNLANGLAADLIFCDVPANRHLYLEHKVDPERVVEIRDL